MSLPLPGFDPCATRDPGPDGDWVVDPRAPQVGAIRPNFQGVMSTTTATTAKPASSPALGISLGTGLMLGGGVAAIVALLGKASK